MLFVYVSEFAKYVRTRGKRDHRKSCGRLIGRLTFSGTSPASWVKLATASRKMIVVCRIYIVSTLKREWDLEPRMAKVDEEEAVERKISKNQ